MYTEKVMDHFTNPRNVGEIENPDGKGTVGNPVCGDIMQISIKVSDSKIEDIKFKTFGCGAAIATSSMVTEMVKGLPLDEALKVSNKAVAEALGGLPPQKMHCSNLAADALHKAIEDYLSKNGKFRHVAKGETAATTGEDEISSKSKTRGPKCKERRDGARPDDGGSEQQRVDRSDLLQHKHLDEEAAPACCSVIAMANRLRDGSKEDGNEDSNEDESE
jgi:nitrogen fixation NifU-like protein